MNASLTELSDRVGMKSLFRSFVLFVACQMLSTGEDSHSLRRFNRTSDLLGKHCFVPELTLMGGDDVFAAFRNSLFDRRLAKKTLTLKETSYMRSVVHCMGYLAVTSDLAKDFLIQAANARFWETNLMWKSEYGVGISGVMAGSALIALGVSGCPEFGPVSDGVIGDVNLRGINEGAVLEAFFHKHLVETRGWEGYRNMEVLFCGMDDFKSAFSAWRKTIEGSKWMSWFLDKSGLRTIYYLDGGELKRHDALE